MDHLVSMTNTANGSFYVIALSSMHAVYSFSASSESPSSPLLFLHERACVCSTEVIISTSPINMRVTRCSRFAHLSFHPLLLCFALPSLVHDDR